MKQKQLKKDFILSLMAFASLGLVFTSCSDNENNDSEKVTDVQYPVAFELPLNVTDPSLKSATVTLTNIETKKQLSTTQFTMVNNQYVDTLSVEAGTYNIDIKGEISYALDDTTTVTQAVKATRENVTINQQTVTKTDPLALNVWNAQEGLVISEIFFTGTQTPEGKSYPNDQYFKIANNSDSTLYLDGVAFMESDFMTITKYDYTPDIMDKAMTIDAIYLFPGSGHDYPIKPGEEKVVALSAIDHKEKNPQSIDLSKADFEIYDESNVPSRLDTQNPDVPDMVNWYDYSNSYFVLHNRGFKAYAIARPTVDKETFLKDYQYQYSYVMNLPTGSRDVSRNGYKFPNSWIIDAVNLSIADRFAWIVTSPSLDAGWTHCGAVDQDKNRFGKAVVRKKSGNKWVDTNNSTNDFEADAVPSLFK